MKLAERTVLITGASRGIGAATARAFANQAAADQPIRLALLARSSDRLQALAAELNARPGVLALPLVADVGQPLETARAVEETAERLGAVDVLVNNAGVGMRSPSGGIDLDSARQMFEVNFWGAIYCIEAVLPAMRARGDGLIVNISSIIGRRAMPDNGLYCASKFALNALSESMRVELRGDNVRVVNFLTGVTDTDFLRHELTGDASAVARGLLPRTPPDVVGRAIVRAARREPREAYATLFDRVFVLGTAHLPRLTDWVLARA